MLMDQVRNQLQKDFYKAVKVLVHKLRLFKNDMTFLAIF